MEGPQGIVCLEVFCILRDSEISFREARLAMNYPTLRQENSLLSGSSRTFYELQGTFVSCRSLSLTLLGLRVFYVSGIWIFLPRMQSPPPYEIISC